MLRQELVHTRKKLETLLAEKEKAEDNVHRIQKVLESERTQLREGTFVPKPLWIRSLLASVAVLKQAKQKIVVTEEARTTAETSLAKAMNAMARSCCWCLCLLSFTNVWSGAYHLSHMYQLIWKEKEKVISLEDRLRK